jgi:hypothetical protein
MAQPASSNVFEGGLEQLRSAVNRVDGEIRRFQRRAEARRERFEKDLRRSGQRRWKQARKQIRSLQQEASQRFERGVERTLDWLPLASKRDVARLDRQLKSLNKKLRDLEKRKATSPPPATA